MEKSRTSQVRTFDTKPQQQAREELRSLVSISMSYESLVETTTSSDVAKAQLSVDAETLLHPSDSQISLSTPSRRPTRHITTSRKLQVWSLCVRKKWLIIGDSNLSRFAPFSTQDLQVDS